MICCLLPVMRLSYQVQSNGEGRQTRESKQQTCRRLDEVSLTRFASTICEVGFFSFNGKTEYVKRTNTRLP